MKNWLMRWVINATALLLTAYLISGIEVNSFFAALIAALVLGIVNTIIKPVLFFFTLPLNILTLGLFTLILNGFMLKITGTVVQGFYVHGFWAATIGAIILSLVSTVLNSLLED